MNTFLRVTWVVGVLAALTYGQRALDAHLRAAPLSTTSDVAPPLELLPQSLGRWCGEDETISAAERSPAGGVRRLYFHADTGQAARVTLRYFAAAGAVAPAPVVAGPAETLTFHWYYALPTPADPRLDVVQKAYRRLHARPAYVAVDVVVPEHFPTDPAAAGELVRFVDAALRQLIGPDAGRYGPFDAPIAPVRS